MESNEEILARVRVISRRLDACSVTCDCPREEYGRDVCYDGCDANVIRHLIAALEWAVAGKGVAAETWEFILCLPEPRWTPTK